MARVYRISGRRRSGACSCFKGGYCGATGSLAGSSGVIVVGVGSGSSSGARGGEVVAAVEVAKGRRIGRWRRHLISGESPWGCSIELIDGVVLSQPVQHASFGVAGRRSVIAIDDFPSTNCRGR